MSVRFEAVSELFGARTWAIYDSVMLVARARFRGPSLSRFSRFLVNSARSIVLPSASVGFSAGHLTDIAIHRGRPRNLWAMFFAATLCMPDSIGSRCGWLRSAPHRSPHAIARLECQEDRPSDASRETRCNVLTFIIFSAGGQRASDQYCSAVLRKFVGMHMEQRLDR